MRGQALKGSTWQGHRLRRESWRLCGAALLLRRSGPRFDPGHVSGKTFRVGCAARGRPRPSTGNADMRFLEHPLWLVGFRPFFSLAFLSGMALPVLWAAMFNGGMAPPPIAISPVQWHAHEMFFGFGWAVLGGFLLTATKNWVQIRGYHGTALMFLVAAWGVERAGMWWQGELPPGLFLLSNNVFLGSIVAMLLWSLVRNREKDSYRDNTFFLLILPAFLVAKQLMLSPEHFQAGVAMALGLFRVAFLVMLERTVTQFMKGACQVAILRDPRLDGAIKLLALALVPAAFGPPLVSGWLGLALAVLLMGRFLYWHPALALRRIDIGILYLGYLALVLQIVMEFVGLQSAWVGAVSVHVFSFGVMGLIIPAMLTRIAKGHTGRKVAFDAGDKWVLRIMLLGFVLRIVVPQLHPAGYVLWIALSAACWCACFGILAWRYIPFLLQARVDGKEH